jgi:hypothetical protein
MFGPQRDGRQAKFWHHKTKGHFGTQLVFGALNISLISNGLTFIPLTESEAFGPLPAPGCHRGITGVASHETRLRHLIGIILTSSKTNAGAKMCASLIRCCGHTHLKLMCVMNVPIYINVPHLRLLYHFHIISIPHFWAKFPNQ